MKKSSPILSIIFISLFAAISCSHQYYTIDGLSGVYIGKSIPPYTENISRSQEEIMAFLSGDSSKYSYSYIVYNELPPATLELNADSTFRIGAVEFVWGRGQWSIIEKDSLMLTFNSYPKDTTHYVAVAISPIEYEGTRKLKISNKNFLQFDYLPYNAPKDSIISVLFKRKK